MKKTALLCFLALFCLCVLSSSSKAAPRVQEVVSPNGIKAWLVEDHQLPIISLRFAFRGGVEQDPKDKQGTAVLLASLLTQGAGKLPEAAFQRKLSDLSVDLDFKAGRDAFYGSLKTLRETETQAFSLLALALKAPRFDASSLARAKAVLLAQQKARDSDPDWQARHALFDAAFRDHPYAFLSLGTPQSVKALSRDDLLAFKRRVMARDTLLIGVAGAISAKELGPLLDRVFGGLPQKASLEAISQAPWPKAPLDLHVPRKGTQVETLFAVPSAPRENPAFYAAEVADYILGSGGFSSRLMKKLRDENGLTYGVRTGLAPMDHAALLIGGFASKNDKAEAAWKMTLDVWNKLISDGPSQAEVEAAKAYLKGSLPIAFTTRDALAGGLVGLQLDRLPRDFWERYPALIDAVSLQDVKEALTRFFSPARVVVVRVGGEK